MWLAHERWFQPCTYGQGVVVGDALWWGSAETNTDPGLS